MEIAADKAKVPLPVFSGEREDFPMWLTRMMAFAQTNGFSQSMRVRTCGLPPSEATTLDETTQAGKDFAKAKKLNDLAMSYLVHTLKTDTLMKYVSKSKSEAYPNGRAWVLMEKLKKKYSPDDLASVTEFKNDLNRVSFGKATSNPDKMFDQISKLQNKYGLIDYKIDWNEIVAHVIRIMPYGYQFLLTKYTRKKDNTEETFEDLENEICEFYRQTNTAADSKQKNDEEEDAEVSLMASNFKGTCFTCKKQGHKASECPNQKTKTAKPDNKTTKACGHCGKKGHNESACWLKNPSKQPEWYKKRMANKANKSETAATNIDAEVLEEPEISLNGVDALTFPPSLKMVDDPNVFVADTGASAHSTGHMHGLYDLKDAEADDSVMNSTGSSQKTAKIASLNGMLCSNRGAQLNTMKLTGVQYVPGQRFNLFSLTKAIRDGWKLGNDGDESIWIEKNDKKIVFDVKIPTKTGFLLGCYIMRNVETATANLQVKEKKLKMSVMAAHERLGHINEAETRKIATALGWELTKGGMGVCTACTIGKAKQKNVEKDSDHKPAEKVNERIFIDCAWIKKPDNPEYKIAATNMWRIMVDETTQLKTSDFFTSKDGMVEPTCETLDKWRQEGKPVKYIRCDNGGENIKLKARAESADWKFGIDFEFTGARTPQRNHLAEVAFATISNRGRALMVRANVPMKWRYKLFPEAFKTATLLDGLVPVMVDGKLATRFEHQRGSNPPWAKHLRVWGEAGTVKTRAKMTPKLADRGVQCMFVGYALEHAGDCYRMMNMKTGRVLHSRDVIWLKSMYFKSEITPANETSHDIDFEPEPEETPIVEAGEGTGIPGTEPTADVQEPEIVDEPAVAIVEGDSDDSDSIASTESDLEDEADAEPTMAATVTRSGRAVRAPERLIEEMGNVSYEIKLTTAELAYYKAAETYPAEFGFVGAGIGGGFDNTNELHVMKFNEAMASADRKKFEKAVEEEHQRMVDHQVFKAIPKSEVPDGGKIITSTWAIKKKSNGTYRARMNARGFEQVNGVHYREESKSSPVVSDITIRIVFVLAVMASMYMEVLDVKGAFLHGEFEDGEKIYMEIPQGFEKYYPKNHVWLLVRTLYGLKQAALAFWRKLVLTMAYIHFKRSKADPCLYYKWDKRRLTLITSVIDDMNIVGSKKSVLEAKKGITKIFDCDEVGETKEYVGLKLDYKPGSYMKITQPVLLQSLSDEFDVPKTDPVATPAVPGEYLKTEQIDVPSKEQRIYRSGVGKLLHLAKWSRVEASNAVRELCKFAGRASSKHMQALKRAMRYMLDTPNRGLLLKPNGKWNGDPNYEFVIHGRSDADYAKDPDTRRSVTGCTTFLEDAPVANRCTGQHYVTMSSAESELGSATTCAQDMLFTMRVLESIGLKVKKPMLLEIDNKGAIDWVNSWSVAGRMRHIDVRECFLRDLREDGLIEVKWIASGDNSSDILTKNLAGPLFEKHAKTYVGIDEYMQYKKQEHQAVRGEGVGMQVGDALVGPLDGG